MRILMVSFMSKKEVLFVGNLISRYRGSKGVTEALVEELYHQGYEVSSTSYKRFVMGRFIAIFFLLISRRFRVVFVDVYSGRAFWLSYLVHIISKVRKYKKVGVLHGGGLVECDANSNGWYGRILSSFDRLYSPSRYLQSEFNSNYGLNVMFMPNGIDFSKFWAAKVKNGGELQVRKLKVIWVRAFDEIYNPLFAIRVFKNVLASLENVELLMVGPDRGLMSDVIDEVNKSDLSDKINILGGVDHSRIPELMRQSDVYFNTTRYESFGVALIEAAACGLPIVSSNVGEIPYSWSDGENILLYDNENEVEATEGLLRVLRSSDLRDKLSNRAFERIGDFDIEMVVSLWKELIDLYLKEEISN